MTSASRYFVPGGSRAYTPSECPLLPGARPSPKTARASSDSRRWLSSSPRDSSASSPPSWTTPSKRPCAACASFSASISRCSGNGRGRPRTSSHPPTPTPLWGMSFLPSRCIRSSSPGSDRRFSAAAWSPCRRWRSSRRKPTSTGSTAAITASSRHLTVPLAVGGEPPVGLIGWNTLRAPRDWPEALVKRLQLVAQVFTNALARRRHELSLRESEERLALAADSAEAGLWTLDYDTGVFWATERARAIFGYSPDEARHMERFAGVGPSRRLGPGPGGHRAVLRERASPSTWSTGSSCPGDGRVRWIASRGRPHLGSDRQAGAPDGRSPSTSPSAGRPRRRFARARLAWRRAPTSPASGSTRWTSTSGTVFVDDRFARPLRRSPGAGGGPAGPRVLDGAPASRRPPARAGPARAAARREAGADLRRVSLPAPDPGREVDPPRRPASPSATPTGRTVKTYGVLRDITERRQREEALRQSLRGDRAAQGPAPGGERLPQGRDQGGPPARRGHRAELRHPEGPAPGGAGRAHGLLGARARRDRHRQGARRPGHPPAQPSPGPPDGQGQLRGAAVRARGERAVRPGEGRLHRGPDAPDRTLRGRGRLDALPRRDRRAVARGAGQAAARAGDGRVRAAGEPQDASRSTCA